MYIDKEFEDHDIYIFRNIIPIDICEKMTYFIEYNDKKTDTDNPTYLKTYHLTDEKKTREMDTDHIDKYTKEIIQNLDKIPSEMSSPVIYRKVYGETKLHIDGCGVNAENGLYRTLSLIFSFNNNKGGRFTFPRQHISFHLNQGDVAVFPPFWTHPHEVSAPEPDTYRYTGISWMYCNAGRT